LGKRKLCPRGLWDGVHKWAGSREIRASKSNGSRVTHHPKKRGGTKEGGEKKTTCGTAPLTPLGLLSAETGRADQSDLNRGKRRGKEKTCKKVVEKLALP